ncbi:myelin-oligodendrocyte glycoprotein-like [Anarrhichthys ocellatus]|uniref:myelin-oligodendrocyte glycoprotein-like n=1 Tax=Anarrhichthys ocellatus TaxID=433405 RepID=UPI0012EE4753|nr:myelin-oligodendrocyte glycoprotein-like [Anarrhichthys ocellatus]
MRHLFGSVLVWTCSLFTLFAPGNMALKDQPQVIGSRQPIVAVLGDDIILPCHLEPKFNVEGLTVEWSLPDLKPDPADPLSRVEYVHLYRHRHEVPDMKIRSYVRRTALFTDELKDGNISLKISNVTLADQGRYRCFIPKLNSPVDQSVVQLVVAPQSDKTSTTEPEFYTKRLPDPDQTDAGGRLHLNLLIPLVVFVSLTLAGGVGARFLQLRQKQNHPNDDVASTKPLTV